VCGTVEAVRLVQEIRDQSRMVGRGAVRFGGEEHVVEKGAFEDGVDKEIECVPNEENAEAAGGGRVEGADGKQVGIDQKADDGEKGDDRCVVNDWWRSRHGCGLSCDCGLG